MLEKIGNIKRAMERVLTLQISPIIVFRSSLIVLALCCFVCTEAGIRQVILDDIIVLIIQIILIILSGELLRATR